MSKPLRRRNPLRDAFGKTSRAIDPNDKGALPLTAALRQAIIRQPSVNFISAVWRLSSNYWSEFINSL
jgi:hypothetical protein